MAGGKLMAKFDKKIGTIVCTGMALALSLGVVTIVLSNRFIDNPVEAEETTYKWALEAGDFIDPSSGSDIALNQAGAEVGFSFSSASLSSGNLVSLSNGGYFYNSDSITSINSVTVYFTGSLTAYHGWYDGSNLVWSENGHTLTSGTALDYTGLSPNYVKFLAAEDTDIASIVYDYDCTASATSYTPPSFTIRLKGGVTVDGEKTTTESLVMWSSLSSSNNGNDNLTYNPASGYYEATFVPKSAITPSSSSMAFQFTVAKSDWTNSNNVVGYKVYITNVGQDIFELDDTVTFGSDLAGDYSLKVNVSLSNQPATMDSFRVDIQNSSFTVGEDWPSNKFEFSEDVATATGLTGGKWYFVLYFWDGSSNSFIVADASNPATYSIDISANTEITITADLGAATTFNNNKFYSGTMKTSGTTTSGDVTVSDMNTTVYGGEDQEGETPTVTFSDGVEEEYSLAVASSDEAYDNVNIRIEGNKIVGLKGGTTTDVVLTTVNSKKSVTFSVRVSNSTYDDNTGTAWETSENWFDNDDSAVTSSTIGQIKGMSSDFANGVDISSCKALYENGANYFNEDGDEQSLFYILKDAGVNWVRLRLWNDPSESYDGTLYDYGGGSCDIERVTWMAHEAHMAGLKVLLDFHYSDFWAHPSQQVMPKAWSGYSSVGQIAGALQTYTKETLIALYNNDALPSMVQLGNELVSSSGMLSKVNATYNTSATCTAQGGNPLYIQNAKTSSYAGTDDNLVTYLKAASQGVDDAIASIGVDNVKAEIGAEDIKKMVHFTSTQDYEKYRDRFSTISASNYAGNFFNNIKDVAYDVAGFSAYPFYDFRDNYSAFKTGLTNLKKLSSLSGKEIMVAETSYVFTAAAWNDYTSDAVYAGSGGLLYGTGILKSYPATIQGQAEMIHDMSADLVEVGGTGMFYWEPAWLPIGDSSTGAYVGWGDAGSKVTWANQALFSYGGKATGSLKVYNLMNPAS